MRLMTRLIFVLLLSSLTFSEEMSFSPISLSREVVPIDGEFSLPLELPRCESLTVFVPNFPGRRVHNLKVIGSNGDINADIRAVTSKEDVSKLVVPSEGWIITLSDIAGGRYVIEGQADHEDPIPALARIHGSEYGFLFLVGNAEEDYISGNPVVLTFFLSKGSTLNQTASVTYKIYSENDLIQESNISDNGQNGDLKAGDGAYHLVFKPSLPGSYRVDVEISGIDNSNPAFSFNASQTFTVRNSIFSLSEKNGISTPDHDNDGYFDELVVTYDLHNIPLEEQSVGIYTQIKAGDKVLEDFGSVDMPSETISSSFSGQELRALQYSGRISIEKAIVGYGNNLGQIKKALGETGVIYFDEWERDDLLLNPHITDTAIDENNDNLLDRIDIGLSIDALKAGDYGMSAAIYDEQSRKIGVFGVPSFKMVLGENEVTLPVSGERFSSYGTDSRLEVRDLFIYSNTKNGALLQEKSVGISKNRYECWDFFGCETGANTNPEAGDDFASSYGEPTVVNVLSNDVDIDGDLLAINAIMVPPQYGKAEIANGYIIYTPENGFVGTDSFSYEVYDVHPERYVWKKGRAIGEVIIAVSENAPPIAEDDIYNVQRGSNKQLALLDNDSDADGDLLYISEITQPDVGNVENHGGFVTFSAPEDFVGETSFSYTVVDLDNETKIAKGTHDSAVVVVKAASDENTPPLAVDDAYTINEVAILPVLENDSDPDGSFFYISQYSSAKKGYLHLNERAFEYTPFDGVSGEDSFTYTITDDQGLTDSAVVSINLAFVNRAPVAIDDRFTTYESQSLGLDVLLNDSDPDGDSLSVVSFTQPKSGAVVTKNNVLVYTPNDKFLGPDSFSYTVSDGETVASASVVIDVVQSVNEPPTITIIKPAGGESYHYGSEVAFFAEASDKEDGALSGFIEWRSNLDGLLFTGSSGEALLSVGEHTIQASIKDSDGLISSKSLAVAIEAEGSRFYSNDNIEIPDHNGRGIDSLIDVNSSGDFKTLHITAEFNHPSLSDIAMSLISPKGRRFRIERPNAKGNAFSGSIDISKLPEITGTWILNVSDQKKGNIGALVGWGLQME